jgi:hypothetical protein
MNVIGKETPFLIQLLIAARKVALWEKDERTAFQKDFFRFLPEEIISVVWGNQDDSTAKQIWKNAWKTILP